MEAQQKELIKRIGGLQKILQGQVDDRLNKILNDIKNGE